MPLVYKKGNDMTENTAWTLDRYREVVELTLAKPHKCPPEVIASLMSDYEDVIRGSWTVGAAPVDVIKLLFAEWQMLRTTSEVEER